MKRHYFSFKLTSVLGLVLYCNILLAQIDMSDSTAIVMAHWQMGEEQKFRWTSQTKTMDEDTPISNKEVAYDISIKVVDSTSVGYVLEWKRTNFEIASEDDLDNMLLRISNDIPFLILTDEFGSSIRSLNWEDAGNEIRNRAQTILEMFKDKPEAAERINQLVQQSESKEDFETYMMVDVQQYLAFHGAKYKLDERIDLAAQLPNYYGGEPLDASATLILDQINAQQGTVIVRSSQRVDPYQLTSSIYDDQKPTGKEGREEPLQEEFPFITQLEWGGSEIHVNSGWVIYSVQTKQTTRDKLVTVEERTIEIVRKSKK